MFKNYLKIAFRNIIRHKTYSIINIMGLAIGMACTILTKNLVLKYFDKLEVIEETITINKKYDAVVTGVFDNVPHNSHFKFTFLEPGYIL